MQLWLKIEVNKNSKIMSHRVYITIFSQTYAKLIISQEKL